MSSDILFRSDMLPSSDLGNATVESQFLDGRGKQLFLRLPSNNSLANRGFRVRLFGRLATTTNTTFQIALYFGLKPTISSNTLLFTSNPMTVNAVRSSFELWTDLYWSADSKSITGRTTGQLVNSVLGPSALAHVPTQVDPNRDSNNFLQSGDFYGFTVSGLFGGSSSGNSAIIDAFQLEGD